MLRTNTCGELTKKAVGREVTLCGWVQSRCDHGGVIFVDLRDRYGITQVVFDPSHNKEVHKTAEHLGREWVLRIVGKVRERRPGMSNPKMATGDVEVISDHLDILNSADTPPFEIEDSIVASEDMRLKYRYLDLRRPVMQKQLMTRHAIAQASREFLFEKSFVEVETPLLMKYTPGGARNYLVPSRVHPGKCFALAESPQIYKQLLMVSGFDRYFQLARCLRDEDLRADRQPEFTQIDIEMSFVTQDDIFAIVEGLLQRAFKKALNKDIHIPFPRFTWHESMSRFGSEKPDTRFNLELSDLTAVMNSSNFGVFNKVIAANGVIFGLVVPDGASFTRKQIEDLEALAKTHHLPGLAWVKVTAQGVEGTPAKFFSTPLQKELVQKVKAKDGDLILFAADDFERATTALGQIRLQLGQSLRLVSEGTFGFCWVVHMPYFEKNPEGGWQAAHHVFTSPMEEDMKYLSSDPGRVRALRYDCAMNGWEIAGGSIRIHKREIQAEVLSVIGLSMEEMEKKFDFLLNAFKFGAPPHGGIAIGFDRLCALIQGLNDIREVVAFPKNKSVQGLMEGSPGEVSDKQLKELHVKKDVVTKLM